MRLVDITNLTGIRLTQAQAVSLRSVIDRGDILDHHGDAVEWDDCFDGVSDVCVDEVAYANARKLIGA